MLLALVTFIGIVVCICLGLSFFKVLAEQDNVPEWQRRTAEHMA